MFVWFMFGLFLFFWFVFVLFFGGFMKPTINDPVGIVSRSF